MRNPAGRRPQTTTPTPIDPWQFTGGGGGASRRDSDSSFCSNIPSSAQSAVPNHHHRAASAVSVSDRSHQIHAVSTINSYLAQFSFPISIKLKTLPSDKYIIETLRFVLMRLDYPLGNKIEDDVAMVLKQFNCPIKMNKSALKSPGTPHSFPSVLAVLCWLVQTAMYNDHVANSAQSHPIYGDSMFSYILNSYMHFISVDDEAVNREDDEFMGKLEQEKNPLLEEVNVLSAKTKDLEVKVEAMKMEPSLKEAKEKEKSVWEEDVVKFNGLIKRLQDNDESWKRKMEEKEKELGVKVDERKLICDENEELKKKVEEQGINMRDAERMKRELQSEERDIGDAEIERNKWEEKCWDLDAVGGTKVKELEALLTECNKAIRRLKLGNGIQYELNAEGKTPVEVLGLDYKSRLEPVLSSYHDELKTSSMENLETLMSLQQLSRDIAANRDAKRNLITILQSQIDEMENQINYLKNETQDFTSSCAMEARRLVDIFEVESQKVDAVEKEARESVESSKAKLQATKTQCEEEVEMCAHELAALIDMVSKHKEFTAGKISEMNKDVSQTIDAVAQIHKDALKPYLGI